MYLLFISARARSVKTVYYSIYFVFYLLFIFTHASRKANFAVRFISVLFCYHIYFFCTCSITTHH